MNIDTADMSVARQFEVYGPDNSSFQMGDTGQPDFDFNTAPVNLNFTPSPAPRPATQRQPRRRVSTSATGARAQGRFRPPVLDTRSVAAPAVAMQRTRSSQAIHPQYPAEQFSINPNFFVGNVTIPDLPWWSQPPFANVTPEYPVNYTFANNQICKTRRPHTVADPCQDANRMADTSSPMEPQPSVLHELRGQQDDYLMNTTGGATIESVTPTSSQQNFQLKVTPPENEGTPDEAKLTRLVVDEIHKFVDQIQKSKSDKAESSLPVEDIVSHFKLSLRSVGSAESSSVSRFTGEADNESAISKTSPISKEGPHICPVCSKTTNRASELKKHIQRHEKPFGCTQDGCQKSFGSKSDWIRHEERCENNKHQQQDFWRCLECRDVLCRDVKQYVRHMSEVHSITALENTRYDPRWRRIARNYQGPFWCGFCNMVIPHHKQGRDAINFRFDHIAEHFTKDKMKIRNWIELSGHGKTKEARSQGAQAPLPPAAALVMDKDDDNTLAPESEGVGTQSCSPDPRVGLGDQVFFPSSQPSSMDIEDLNVLEHFSFNGQFQDLQQKLTGQMSTTTMTLQAPGHSKAMYAYPARATRRQRQHHQQCHKPMQERAQSVTCCQCEVSANVSLSKFCINCPHEFCPACEYKGAPKEDR